MRDRTIPMERSTSRCHAASLRANVEHAPPELDARHLVHRRTDRRSPRERHFLGCQRSSAQKLGEGVRHDFVDGEHGVITRR